MLHHIQKTQNKWTTTTKNHQSRSQHKSKNYKVLEETTFCGFEFGIGFLDITTNEQTTKQK